MELKPNSAKVIDLAVSFEPASVETSVGNVLWATVQIEYALAGMTPVVNIRVPIPFEGSESEAGRRAQALRSARLLIDHACRAAGIAPDEPISDRTEDFIADIVPSALEGVAQELGITEPTMRSKRAGRAKG